MSVSLKQNILHPGYVTWVEYHSTDGCVEMLIISVYINFGSVNLTRTASVDSARRLSWVKELIQERMCEIEFSLLNWIKSVMQINCSNR